MGALRSGLRRGLRRVGAATVDFLYPPQCLKCGAAVAESGALCATCWSSVEFIAGPVCHQCGLPFEFDAGAETVCAGCLARPPAYSRVRAAFRYGESARELVLPFKHGDRLEGVPSFAQWLSRAGGDVLADADLLVPVPLHRWRLFQRRYNQSALLANALARMTGVPCLPDALRRTRPTPSQGEMKSARARRQNVQRAFALRPKAAGIVRDRRVVLIDDVMTTGATLDACARALRRAGAADVTGLVLARVVRDGTSPL